MNSEIQEIFKSLSASNKDVAKYEISKATGNTVGTISFHWLYSKGVPEKHQQEVYEIVTNVLQDQLNGYQKLIDLKNANKNSKTRV